MRCRKANWLVKVDRSFLCFRFFHTSKEKEETNKKKHEEVLKNSSTRRYDRRYGYRWKVDEMRWVKVENNYFQRLVKSGRNVVWIYWKCRFRTRTSRNSQIFFYNCFQDNIAVSQEQSYNVEQIWHLVKVPFHFVKFMTYSQNFLLLWWTPVNNQLTRMAGWLTEKGKFSDSSNSILTPF